MTNSDKLLLKMLQEAAQPGEAAEPSELLFAIADQSNPIQALCNFDQANTLFAKFAEKFNFVRTARITGNPLNDDDRKALIALFRWLIRELSQWCNTNDPQHVTLAAIFVVMQFCDSNGVLWSALPNNLGEITDLADTLERMLSASTVKMTPRNNRSVPIWEQEAVASFVRADQQGDWITIAREWQKFENAMLPNFVHAQMVRYLYRFGFKNLARAVTGISQSPFAMHIAAALPVEERLTLANASDNPYIQFGCVLQTSAHHPRQDPLSTEARELLTALLLKVANDRLRWKAWMQAFNYNPQRYPALHIPLGYALATVPDAAVEAYIESINLCPTPAEPNGSPFWKPDASRQCVADCLQQFKQKAALERRKLLWTYAQTRWLRWRFNETRYENYLFGIYRSQLDYAIVGYAIECVGNTERTLFLDSMRKKLTLLDNDWHLSLSHAISEWNRLLSQFQPYAHGEVAAEKGEDWLTDNRIYRPFDPSKEPYIRMMFSI